MSISSKTINDVFLRRYVFGSAAAGRRGAKPFWANLNALERLSDRRLEIGRQAASISSQRALRPEPDRGVSNRGGQDADRRAG